MLASTYPRWPDDHEPNFVHELCRRLCTDFEVTVLTSHAPGSRRQERMHGVDVIRYRYAPESLQTLVYGGGIVTQLRRSPWKAVWIPSFVLGQYIAARRIMRRCRIDIVHAHWLLPQGWVARRLARRTRRPPYVVTAHGADLYALRNKLMRKLEREVCAGSAAVTVVSHAMSADILRLGLCKRPPEVMPMGVDMSGRFTVEPSVARSRDEILFVGRLVEKKGLRVLIEAMPRVLQSRPGAFLTVVGQGPELPACRLRAEALGLQDRVRFHGAVAQQNLPAFYRRAAVFAAPFIEAASGDREGLGLVSVEALACGCPVILGDLSAVRDVLGQGHAQKLVPPGDIGALAEALVQSLSHPPGADVMNRERKRLAEQFDWSRVSARYAGLLGSCLSGMP